MTKSVLFFLVALATFSAISCGKRITTNNSEAVKKDTLSILMSKKDLKIDSVFFVLNSEFEIIPIDNSKPLIVNGVKIVNGSIHKKEKIESWRLSKIDKSIVSKQNSGTTKTSKKEKTTQKEDEANLYVGLFLVFCFFVFAYFKKWF